MHCGRRSRRRRCLTFTLLLGSTLRGSRLGLEVVGGRGVVALGLLDRKTLTDL
jgi:hypothetical protein